MKIGRRFAFSVSLAAVASSASAAPRDVSDVVAGVLSRHQVPGLVGAIVELDGATAIGVAGVRKAGSPELLRVGDAIHLGSDTKAMTATLVAQLIQSGELTYETTMADAFPALAPRMNAAMAKATVEQLLAHRGGVPANVAWANYADGPVAAQRLKIVEAVLSAPPASAPGTAYAYSNVGYVILGAIVEAKTKLSWEDEIAQRLFKPLEMTSAGFGPPDAAWGHVVRGGAYQPIQLDNPESLGPAGAGPLFDRGLGEIRRVDAAGAARRHADPVERYGEAADDARLRRRLRGRLADHASPVGGRPGADACRLEHEVVLRRVARADERLRRPRHDKRRRRRREGGVRRAVGGADPVPRGEVTRRESAIAFRSSCRRRTGRSTREPVRSRAETPRSAATRPSARAASSAAAEILHALPGCNRKSLRRAERA